MLLQLMQLERRRELLLLLQPRGGGAGTSLMSMITQSSFL
jgi:hypothetical protein